MSQYSIVECVPGKALYLLDHIINMQYKLKILDNANNQTITTLVNARLFQDLSGCKTYLDNTLMPIAARMDDRPEIKPFARPVAIVEHLNMTLSVFPIDGMIPTLVDATDPNKIASILAETLPEALSGEFFIKDVRLLLAHYGRYKRCVLRYSIDGMQTETQTPQNVTVYGKVDADGLGGLTVSIISALRERLQRTRSAVSIPYSPFVRLFSGLTAAYDGSSSGKTFFQGIVENMDREHGQAAEMGIPRTKVR